VTCRRTTARGDADERSDAVPSSAGHDHGEAVVEVLQMIRDVVVGTVLAGAMTALVLGHGIVGLILLAAGATLLTMAMRGHKYLSFGVSR
jgi:hypothetical protein